MKRYFSLLAAFFIAVCVKAQIPITDVGNGWQNSLDAVNTSSTVVNMKIQIDQIQKSLDFVEKVSSAVRDVRIYKDMITRQNKLNNDCLATLEKAKSLKLSNMSKITSSIESVVNNNANIISMTSSILKSDLKMNDAQRLKNLNNCKDKVREEEVKLGKIKSIISYSQTAENNINNFFKK